MNSLKMAACNSGYKAKAVRAFLCVLDFILTPPKLRFDVKRCTFVKQSFGSVKFERSFQVRPSLHNRERKVQF